MRKIKLVTGEYYHIYNRGVEKRKIFIDNADYFRFLIGMREFNERNSHCILRSVLSETESRRRDRISVTETESRPNKEPLVELICYCLIPNHYHFILRQTADDGISKFMQKLGVGYTAYFNKRSTRTGVLFQGAFKVAHINNDAYLLHLSRYIHLNPLDIFQPDWRKIGIKDREKAQQFLKSYRWSSFSFFIDKNKRCLIKLSPNIITAQFGNLENYEKFVTDWMAKDFVSIAPLVIENDLVETESRPRIGMENRRIEEIEKD